MKQNFKRKLLAGLLSACMIFQTAGMVPVYAVDSGLPTGTSSVCTHHVHDEKCGYTEGTPCTFDPATCESCKAKNTADNIVTLAVEEVYAVYDGIKFCAATQIDPTTATATEITNKTTINNLYIMGGSVPDNLIGDSNAVNKNTNLKTVTCENTVITIGKQAFKNCTALTSVTMPNVTTIGQEVFKGCANLTSVTMPNATTIEKYAFEDCAKLASVAMPKATTIGNSAFNGCAKLASLTLGETPPATVGIEAFSYCPKSRTLTIQGNTANSETVLTTYKAVGDGDTADDKWYGWTLPNTMVATPSAGTLEITKGEATSNLGQDNAITLTATFNKAAKAGKQRALAINQVEFKDGTTSLGTATATKNDKGEWVATLNVNTKYWAGGAHKLTAEYAGNNELGGSTTNEVTVIVNEVYAVYDGSSKKFCAATAESPKVPTTTEITDKKTINHLYIMGGSVPKGLMGDWSNPCLNLKTVICADTVTTIGTNAFQRCKGLTSIDVSGATTINKEAFDSCISLASVAIPKVEVIKESGFISCKALTSVKMPKVTSIGKEAFYSCAKLASVEMPNVTTIGKNSFSGCANLASVKMPKVITIDDDAFYNCTNLASVKMPKVTSIGKEAFYSCAKLASLTLGAMPPATVGTEAFTGCSDSRTLTIQGNTAYQGTVLAAYKTAADGNLTDNLWYGWTLPTSLDGTGVSNSAGTLEVTIGNSNPTVGAENAITLTATFNKAAKAGKQRALAINDVEFKDGTNTLVAIATATQNAEGKWVATINVNTKDWAVGAHNLTAEFAGNHELLGASTTNEVTVTVNESYAVWDGSKFYVATAGAPSTATETAISDKKTISHLYIMGASVPANLIGDLQSTENTTLKTVTCADTVTTIGEGAFKNCASLQVAVILNGCGIGTNAFTGVASEFKIYVLTDGKGIDGITGLNTIEAGQVGTTCIYRVTTEGENLGTTFNTVTNELKTKAAVTSVTVAPEKKDVAKGATATFTATVVCKDNPVQVVTWASSHPEIATIDATGRVTAMKAGTATITATSAVDPDKSGTATVTVTEPSTGGGGGGGVIPTPTPDPTAPIQPKEHTITNADGTKTTVLLFDGTKSGTPAKGEALLSAEALAKIAAVKGAGAVVATSTAIVQFDQKALEAITGGQTKGNIKVIAEIVNPNTLTPEEKALLGDNALIIDLSVENENGKVTDFNGGTATVVINIPAGVDPTTLGAVYIKTNGKLEKVEGKVVMVNGVATFQFVTNHFSKFAVLDKATIAKAIAAQEAMAKDKLVKGVKATKLTAIKAVAKKSNVTVTWKKSKGYKVDGYQIWKSSKKTTGYKMMAKRTGQKYKNTYGLKAGKTYYYKVRGFREIDGKIVYTKWAKAKVVAK